MAVFDLAVLDTKGNLTRTTATNPAAAYLAGLKDTGRYTQASKLNHIARLLGCSDWRSTPWEQLHPEHVIALRTRLTEQYKHATVNTHMAAIRGTMRAAWRLGLVDSERYQRIRDIEAGKLEETLPAGRYMTPGEMAALMRICMADRTAAGSRDATVIALMYGGGLRREEVVDLDLLHLVDDDGEACPGPEDRPGVITIKVTGKRGKERLVYLDNGAAYAMRDWLALRGDAQGPLFWPGRRGGNVTPGLRMTGRAIDGLLKKRCRQAGIEPLSPHDLRRSFVSDLLEANTDIATVAKMAGHSNIQTTMRYDRRPEAAKKRAARSLHVPYIRRATT
jgi:site-specific recombinase XerD